MGINIYRRFQLFVHEYNYSLDICMVLHMLLINTAITVTLYGTIRYYGTLDIIALLSLPGIGIPCSVFAVTAYPNGGVLQSYAEKFRRVYRKKIQSYNTLSSNEEKELNYYITVSRNVNITFGSFYNYNKSTIFTFFDIIIYNTITLLLAFP